MTEEEAAPAGQQLPPMVIEAQYLKDLSFENPQGIGALAALREAPRVNVEIRSNARRLGENRFEVTLTIHGSASIGEQPLFVVESTYAGVFSLNGIPDETVHPVLLIEAPRQLFPFARSIVANASRDGGFPPLLINPIDFGALYRQQHMTPDGAPSTKIE